MKTTTFNRRVFREQRKKLNLSREDLVVRLAGMGLRVSASSIIRWEDGNYTPDAGDLPTIARALELQVGDFYDDADSRSR